MPARWENVVRQGWTTRSFIRISGCVRRQDTVSGDTASRRFSSGLSSGRIVSKGSTVMARGGLVSESLFASALMTTSVGIEPSAEELEAEGWAADASCARAEEPTADIKRTAITVIIIVTPGRT